MVLAAFLPAGISVWQPSHVAGFAVVVTAFLLGMVHGITPDEHTWPITFSYSIGGYSTRRGLRTGLTFSLAFTLQRAIASELASVGLSRLFTFASLGGIVYVVVGVLMAGAGMVIVRRRRTVHLHLRSFRRRPAGPAAAPAGSADEPGAPDSGQFLADPRPWMPAVHGFVAGWGFGPFALVIYTVLAPAVHSAAWGWVPGACFGLGTTLVQAVAGGLFGRIAARRGLSAESVRRVALRTAGNTLTWGGLAFLVGGGLSLLFPVAMSFSVPTGIRVHNLDTVNLGLVLAVFTVAGVGMSTLVRQTRMETRVGHG